jgi:hypothetical protein
MKFSVFGKNIEVIERNSKWVVFYFGNEGKKRLAEDIIVPPDILEDQLIEYLSDLCHEWARPNYSEVKKLD